MNTPMFFVLLGALALLWYELGLVGMILFCSYSEHPVKLMEKICKTLSYCKPKGWFVIIIIAGLVTALLGPLMLGLAFLVKPRKRPSMFAKAVLK